MKSQQAQAAAAIRKELKANFPSVTFSVTSESFSMGDAVRISWTDGPTTDQVESFSKKYQYGSFDGMTDMYENTNSRDDLPQSKYVTSSRTMSPVVKETLKGNKEIGWANPESYEFDRAVYQLFAKTSF